MEERVIVGSGSKSALLLAGFIVLLAGSILVLRNDHTTKALLVGWLGSAVFSVGAAVALVQLWQPNRLILSGYGFALECVLRRPVEIAWSDIDSFFVWKNRHSRLVGYRYKPGRAPPTRMTRVNQMLGLDGGLPGGWPIKAEALVELMNAYRLGNSGQARGA